MRTWNLGAFALAFGLVVAVSASAADRPSAVIELYTSQGCSSCPPADRYLAEMADRPDLIALTFPVDYWDYLGWKDTLADPAHAKRQRGYAAARGDRQVYTPQMVVNGVAHAVGSDRVAVERAVTRSGAQFGVLSVPVTITTSGDAMTIALPAQQTSLVSPEAPATIMLLGVAAQASVEIVRGENRGANVVYRNVVRSHAVIGEWSGEARTFTVSRLDRLAPGCERAVVLVQVGQTRRPGAVLGAAMARFQ